MLGVALDDRHRRLHLREQVALLARLDERDEAALAEALDELLDVGERRQPAGARLVEADLDQLKGLLESTF